MTTSKKLELELEKLKGNDEANKAFSAKKEVLKYGVKIDSETLDDFSRAFVYGKTGGHADEYVYCLDNKSHIHVAKTEPKAILDAYIWVLTNIRDKNDK